MTHEEADVLMVYHVIQEAKNGHESIKVGCDDTDVLVILSHHLHYETTGLSRIVNLLMESFS